MDFRTERGRYHKPQPHNRGPVAQVPARPAAVQPEPPADTSNKRIRESAVRKSRPVKRVLQILAAALLIGLIIWLVHGYITAKNQLEQQKASGSGQSPTQQLTDKVSKKVELPAETPVIYTVNDAKKLTNQAFFVDAKDGDKVLYFPGAKVAVLYRPSTDKVIRYQPVSLEGTASGTSSSP